MPVKPVAEMSFDEWMNRPESFEATQPILDDLSGAVAYFLYITSKDVPDDEAGLYRAAALALINKPVDPVLMEQAGRKKSNDDPLYNSDYRAAPDLQGLWLYHHRMEVESAEKRMTRAY